MGQKRTAISWDAILYPGKTTIRTKKGIHGLMNSGGFPRPFKMGRGIYAVNCWWEDEVDAWIAKRATETRRAA